MAITSVAAQVTAQGVLAPSFSDSLQFLVDLYKSIYGSDSLLDASTQDGQFLGALAQVITDVNAAIIAVYNSYAPSTATGNALSQQVAINGLTRDVSSNSTVDLLCTGVAGTILSNAVVADPNNIQWILPASVVVPSGGQITATATCSQQGAITAPAGTTWTQLTPVKGWQTQVNLTDAVPGQPVEDDAALRVRQANSVAAPALSVLEAIYAAVADVSGVTRQKIYENDTASTDANGIPAHSIAVVVEGGTDTDIATAIASRKTPGTGLYGSTTESVTDSLGTRTISFSRPTDVSIAVAITLTALDGYTTLIGDEISQAVADYVNSVAIGQSVLYSRLYVPANFSGSTDSLTYDITQLRLAGGGAGLGTSDISIAFNAVATMQASDVTITVS